MNPEADGFYPSVSSVNNDRYVDCAQSACGRGGRDFVSSAKSVGHPAPETGHAAGRNLDSGTTRPPLASISLRMFAASRTASGVSLWTKID